MPTNPSHVTLVKYLLTHAGGLEKQTWRIAKAYARKGIPVKILTAQSDFNERLYPLIDVEKLPLKRTLFPYQQITAFDRACHAWQQKNPSDIVLALDRTSANTHIRAGLGVHAAFLKERIKCESRLKRLSFKINPLHQTILKLEKLAFENPNLRLLFTNSHMVKQEVQEHYATPENKIQVIHNGVEWHEMERSFADWVNSKNQTTLDLNLDPLSFHFLFVGNGYKRKGLDIVLKALCQIKKEDFHLSIVGKDKDVKVYLEMVDDLGLSEKVSFFGPQKDLNRFYQYADALVIPSLYDPFANVTVEALAMGLFVVSSKTNGGHEILDESKGVIIDDLFDESSVVSALLSALDHPKTWVSSQRIRDSIQYLDFQNQLNQLIDYTLSS